MKVLPDDRDRNMVQGICSYSISQKKRKNGKGNQKGNPKRKDGIPRVAQLELNLLVLAVIMTCYIKMILGKM